MVVVVISVLSVFIIRMQLAFITRHAGVADLIVPFVRQNTGNDFEYFLLNALVQIMANILR